MDLIATLAPKLGLDPQAAEALAGAVLGAARTQVPDAETAKLDEAVPEIDAWSKTAERVLAEPDDGDGDASGGMLGMLAKAAGSGLGNELLGAVMGEDAQEAATVVALFQKLGLEPSHAAMAAPMVVDFLEERVGDAWAERIVKAAPVLLELVQENRSADSSSLSSLMGRLLG